jgi:hypothetical protein
MMVPGDIQLDIPSVVTAARMAKNGKGSRLLCIEHLIYSGYCCKPIFLLLMQQDSEGDKLLNPVLFSIK